MLSPMVWAARLSTSLAGFLVVFSALGAGTYWIFSAKQKVEDAFLLNTATDANRVEFTVPDASLVGLTVSEIHNLFSAYGPEGRKAFLHMALLDLFMYEVLYWLGLTISLAAVLRWNGCYIPFDESFSHSHSSAELHRHLGNHSHSHGPSIYSAVLHRSGGSSLSLPHSHSHGDLSFLSASGLHSVDHEGLTPNSGKNQRRIGGVPHSPDAVPHSRTGHAHDDHSLQDHIADPLAQSSTTSSPKPITVAAQKLHGHSHSHGPGQPVHTHWHIHKGRDVGDHSHAHAHSHGAGQPIHTHTHSHGPIESSGDWQWRLLYGPLMTVVFDTMENICNYYLCYTFPSGWIPVVASWGSICTQLKYLFLFLSLTAIPFLVIRAILKPSSKGKSATD